MQSVVTRQAPITLERKINQRENKHKQQIVRTLSETDRIPRTKKKVRSTYVRIRIHMYHMLNKSRRKGRPRRQHRTHKKKKSLYSYHSVKTYDLWSIWHHEVQRTWRKERNKVWPPVSYVVVPIPCSKCKDWLKLGNISGSYSFTEPSRITRVGNRNFMKRISADTYVPYAQRVAAETSTEETV